MTIKSADSFLLGARVLLYAALAASLSSEPSASVLGELTDRLLALKRDMAGQRLPELRRSVDAMLKALASSTPEALAIDYADLFLSGKNGSLVPTESAYLEKMLHGRSTMEVTESYAEFGFIKESSFTEPSDHIAVECAFMAALGAGLLESAGEDNQVELEGLVEAQSNFLEFHIGQWAPGWAEKLKAVAGTDFYRAVAGLVTFVLAADRDLLTRLSDEIRRKGTIG